jgi:hypothetical protein
MAMKIYLYFLFAIIAGLLLITNAREGLDAQAPQPKQNGMTYAGWWSGEYSQPEADLALQNLAATGSNWIALIVTGYQNTINSTSISFTDPQTPTDADLIHVITLAHKLGLKVMLKPHVDLLVSNQSRGQIGKNFDTNSEWNAWFSSYRDFIEHYAELAEMHGVDQFTVGTELMSTAYRENDWRAVIAAVRQRYHGPITYAALYGGEETAITWWDAVDYIGVDAYYELTDKNNPSLTELKQGWVTPVNTLTNLANTWGKSILFTEIGYRSVDGANRQPWNSSGGGGVDLQEQADAYQAAFESVYDQPWFAGMFWWYWSTSPFKGGACDTDYTPYQKPAEDVLRSWYGAPHSGLDPDYNRTMKIYTDRLETGWQDWSWDATRNLAATDHVYSGSKAVAATLQPWGGLSFRHSNFASEPYTWVEFYWHSSNDSPTEQQLWLFVENESNVDLSQCAVDISKYVTEGSNKTDWKQVRIPLIDLGGAGRTLNRISIQYRSDNDTASFWVDEFRLLGAASNAPIGSKIEIFVPIIFKKWKW